MGLELQNQKIMGIKELVDVPFENIEDYKKDPNYRQRFGSIYFVRAFALNRIKIGLTVRSLKERVEELQTGSCTTLFVMGYSTYQNPLEVETCLHNMFGQFRVREGGKNVGEWFHGHHMLYNFIWQFADRISVPDFFPSDVLDGSSVQKFKVFNPMMKVKETTYYDEYKQILDKEPVKQLSKTYIQRYEKQIRDLKNA